MTELNRRTLITGLISLIAAPAIVRVSSIMPVRAMLPVQVAKELEVYRVAVLVNGTETEWDWKVLSAAGMRWVDAPVMALVSIDG